MRYYFASYYFISYYLVNENNEIIFNTDRLRIAIRIREKYNNSVCLCNINEYETRIKSQEMIKELKDNNVLDLVQDFLMQVNFTHIELPSVKEKYLYNIEIVEEMLYRATEDEYTQIFRDNVAFNRAVLNKETKML